MREIEQANERIANLQKREGAVGEQIFTHKQRYTDIQTKLAAERDAGKAVELLLQPHIGDAESVAYYVLRTWRGQQFDRIENVQTELQKVERNEVESIARLRERLGHPVHSALFGFTYDMQSNQLVDRTMCPIQEVVAASQLQIDQQREVINERTRELMRNIIMGDFFTELKASIRRLRDMVRKTNYLLEGRVFGSNKYRFRIDEEKRYCGLLGVIETYNPLDPSARKEMEHFLELHREEIMATDVNEVPAALDYRNWFRYELTMSPSSEDGEVVISRKTKSLGSGGEQAVPNYLLILTVAHFLYDGNDELRTRALLFDEAFYGIDTGRRDQLLGFASDLGLQLFIASPDLDGVKQEIPCSTTLLVVKDAECNVHLFACDFTNPRQLSLLDGPPDPESAEFGDELGVTGNGH